jgi:hypothetical protein
MKSELKQKSYSSRRTGLPTLFEVINMALGLKREILSPSSADKANVLSSRNTKNVVRKITI